jgi:hypothetical protein
MGRHRARDRRDRYFRSDNPLVIVPSVDASGLSKFGSVAKAKEPTESSPVRGETTQSPARKCRETTQQSLVPFRGRHKPPPNNHHRIRRRDDRAGKCSELPSKCSGRSDEANGVHGTLR